MANLKITNYHNPIVPELKAFCSYVPRLDIKYNVKPIAQTILKIDISIKPIFKFNPKWHLKSEVFWILFDN
jgi:hypothetical protein